MAYDPAGSTGSAGPHAPHTSHASHRERDPNQRWLRRRGQRVHVAIWWGGYFVRLGAHVDEAAARETIKAFVAIAGQQQNQNDPHAARIAFAKQMAQRTDAQVRLLPPWVRFRCNRPECRKVPRRGCNCKRTGKKPLIRYVADVRVPAAKTILGPFATPEKAYRAAVAHLIATLGVEGSRGYVDDKCGKKRFRGYLPAAAIELAVGREKGRKKSRLRGQKTPRNTPR